MFRENVRSRDHHYHHGEVAATGSGGGGAGGNRGGTAAKYESILSSRFRGTTAAAKLAAVTSPHSVYHRGAGGGGISATSPLSFDSIGWYGSGTAAGGGAGGGAGSNLYNQLKSEIKHEVTQALLRWLNRYLEDDRDERMMCSCHLAVAAAAASATGGTTGGAVTAGAGCGMPVAASPLLNNSLPGAGSLDSNHHLSSSSQANAADSTAGSKLNEYAPEFVPMAHKMYSTPRGGRGGGDLDDSGLGGHNQQHFYDGTEDLDMDGSDAAVALMIRRGQRPSDPSLEPTHFRARQVWPDWVRTLPGSPRTRNEAANSRVYHDRFNDRLCVFRRGLVEYPQQQQQQQPTKTGAKAAPNDGNNNDNDDNVAAVADESDGGIAMGEKNNKSRGVKKLRIVTHADAEGAAVSKADGCAQTDDTMMSSEKQQPATATQQYQPMMTQQQQQPYAPVMYCTTQPMEMAPQQVVSMAAIDNTYGFVTTAPTQYLAAADPNQALGIGKWISMPNIAYI